MKYLKNCRDFKAVVSIFPAIMNILDLAWGRWINPCFEI
jgi:hypothetical protein